MARNGQIVADGSLLDPTRRARRKAAAEREAAEQAARAKKIEP
jgi:hypothetical protein